MNKFINILTYQDLVAFLNRDEVNKEMVSEIISKSLSLFFVEKYESKNEMIDIFCQFWRKYENYQTKPLFIDVKL